MQPLHGVHIYLASDGLANSIADGHRARAVCTMAPSRWLEEFAMFVAIRVSMKNLVSIARTRISMAGVAAPHEFSDSPQRHRVTLRPTIRHTSRKPDGADSFETLEAACQCAMLSVECPSVSVAERVASALQSS